MEEIINETNPDEVKNLNAFTVCNKIGIGLQTLANWYRYKKSGNVDPELPELPEYYQLNSHSVRLWSLNDIEKLILFKQKLGRGRAGKMGDWNAKFWQERGKKALENKQKKEEI